MRLFAYIVVIIIGGILWERGVTKMPVEARRPSGMSFTLSTLRAIAWLVFWLSIGWSFRGKQPMFVSLTENYFPEALSALLALGLLLYLGRRHLMSSSGR